ncbi:MAG: SDR family oxidoreductase [Gemmataceae bacterium]|nr:SDR family oxidoreductase [Gemmataceae bacterium]
MGSKAGAGNGPGDGRRVPGDSRKLPPDAAGREKAVSRRGAAPPPSNGEGSSDMGRVIVITGVTRGLGRALAEEFIAGGHVVAGCGRDARRIAELQERYGTPHLLAAVDVQEEAAVRRWAGDVLARLGPPDLLINNAAVMARPAPLWQLPAEEFRRSFAVNVAGMFYVLQAFLPAMVERRRGVIVNLSSTWGRSTAPRVATYCATKYAVEGLTLALAQELPRGMAAIPLNPGIIDTDMLRSIWGANAGRYPKAEAWAKRAAPFLLQLSADDNGKSLTVP